MKLHIYIFYLFLISLNLRGQNIPILDITSSNTKLENYNVDFKDNWPSNCLFIGNYKKIIPINPNDNFSINAENTITYENPKEFKIKKNELKLTLVDNQPIFMKIFEFWTKEKVTKFYNSYPLIIQNISNEDKIIGLEAISFITLQALDTDNEWKDIEEIYTADCLVGSKFYFLKPNQIAIFNVIKYNGNFKTKLRYSIGLNFSNEFDGYINKSQFTKKHDKYSHK